MKYTDIFLTTVETHQVTEGQYVFWGRPASSLYPQSSWRFQKHLDVLCTHGAVVILHIIEINRYFHYIISRTVIATCPITFDCAFDQLVELVFDKFSIVKLLFFTLSITYPLEGSHCVQPPLKEGASRLLIDDEVIFWNSTWEISLYKSTMS